MWKDKVIDGKATRYAVKVDCIESCPLYLNEAFKIMSLEKKYKRNDVGIFFGYSTSALTICPLVSDVAEENIDFSFHIQIESIAKEFKEIRIKWNKDDDFREQATLAVARKVRESLVSTLSALESLYSMRVRFFYYKTMPFTYEDISMEL